MAKWEEDGEGHECVDGRFKMLTWEFGSIHQAKIMIDYQDDRVGICLSPGRSRKEAMWKCEAWVDNFLNRDPDSPETVIATAMKHWPSLYSNKISVLDQIMFTIGGGYTWLDGAIVNTSPDSWKDSQRMSKSYEREMKKQKKLKKLLAEARSLLGQEEEKRETREEFNSKYWGSDVHRFYPVSMGYSNICKVPDDVKPDWLVFAYQAALLLRDKSGLPDIESIYYAPTQRDEKQQEENRAAGALVVADLEKRFPHVKEVHQVSSKKA